MKTLSRLAGVAHVRGRFTSTFTFYLALKTYHRFSYDIKTLLLSNRVARVVI